VKFNKISMIFQSFCRFSSLQQYNTVELDYTYYSMPRAANLAKMLVDGGPALTFSIKAHETLTHTVDPKGWKEKGRNLPGGHRAGSPGRAAGGGFIPVPLFLPLYY
jgi:hypothetical protein